MSESLTTVLECRKKVRHELRANYKCSLLSRQEQCPVLLEHD